jgi:hypothetical protein
MMTKRAIAKQDAAFKPADLMAKVEFDTNGGCWLWSGRVDRYGYGTKMRSGRRGLAHREFYRSFVGPIKAGLFVCHKCDVPTCVNPAHLFAGTHLENMLDMHRKGRAKGTASRWPASLMSAFFESGMSVRDAVVLFGVPARTLFRWKAAAK